MSDQDYSRLPSLSWCGCRISFHPNRCHVSFLDFCVSSYLAGKKMYSWNNIYHLWITSTCLRSEKGKPFKEHVCTECKIALFGENLFNEQC